MGHVPDLALGVAESNTAQRDPLDLPGRVTEIDGVADAVLILGKNEQTGDHIADQRLGAKGDRTTDHRGGGDETTDVDTDLADDRDDRRGPDDADHGGTQRTFQRTLPCVGTGPVAARNTDRSTQQTGHNGPQHDGGNDGDDDDREDPQWRQQVQVVETVDPQRLRICHGPTIVKRAGGAAPYLWNRPANLGNSWPMRNRNKPQSFRGHHTAGQRMVLVLNCIIVVLCFAGAAGLLIGKNAGENGRKVAINTGLQPRRCWSRCRGDRRPRSDAGPTTPALPRPFPKPTRQR